MTARELYSVFTTPLRPWSKWVKPVLFADLDRHNPTTITIPAWKGPTLHSQAAWIIDLDGIKGFSAALGAVQEGLFPVPLYNGVNGPKGVVNTAPLLAALPVLAHKLQHAALPLSAPPAFMLDAGRCPTSRSRVLPGDFDNRWMVFPQDFPSHRFLREHGIHTVCILQEGSRIADDLLHILRRWQDGGITLHLYTISGKEEIPVRVSKPPYFRYFFYRALAMTGLRRNSAGGFGAMVPIPQQSSSSYTGFG